MEFSFFLFLEKKFTSESTVGGGNTSLSSKYSYRTRVLHTSSARFILSLRYLVFLTLFKIYILVLT